MHAVHMGRVLSAQKRYLVGRVSLEVPAEGQLLLQSAPLRGHGCSLCSLLQLCLKLLLLLLLLLEMQQLLVLLSREPGGHISLDAFAERCRLRCLSLCVGLWRYHLSCLSSLIHRHELQSWSSQNCAAAK